MENVENVENTVEAKCKLDPEFNWEITVDNSEERITEKEQFVKDLETFNSITNSLSTPEEKVQIIIDFYDNIIPDAIWNEYMQKYFKTKLAKNFNINTQRKLTLINYEIGESKKSLNDVRYMTSTCERSTAWLINEDKNFANEKPEVLSFFKTKLYSATAKIQEEKVQIPFFDIGSTLRLMCTELPYIYEYCFYKVYGYLHRKVIRSRDMVNLIEKEPSFAMGIVRYRNSEEFGNNPAWNLVIRNHTVVKDIGYFSVSSYGKYIGNIWVDPAFRRKGVMDSMFKYIKNNILPKEDFLFIATKNPTVMKALSSFKTKYIGKDLPYISSNAPYELKQKLARNYLETIFCLAHDKIPSNEVIFNTLNNNEILFTEESFPYLLSDGEKPGGEQFINMMNKNGLSRLKYICTTNDKNIVPEYYNFYSSDFKNHSNTHIVFELDNNIYLYPYFDGELLVPLNAITSIAHRIEEFKIDVLFNGDETIVIKHTNKEDKIIFRGKLLDNTIGKNQIQLFFEYIQYGIERVQVEEFYTLRKEEHYAINRDGYHAIEIDGNQVKFVSNIDTQVVVYKNIEEVIKNFPIN